MKRVWKLLIWAIIVGSTCTGVAQSGEQVRPITASKFPLPPEDQSAAVTKFSFIVYGGWKAKAKPSTRAKWRSSLSACRGVEKKGLTELVLLETPGNKNYPVDSSVRQQLGYFAHEKERSRTVGARHCWAAAQNVFPDTAQNEARFWRNIISGQQRLTAVQIVGIVIIGLMQDCACPAKFSLCTSPARDGIRADGTGSAIHHRIARSG
jgi:hypothetical protein